MPPPRVEKAPPEPVRTPPPPQPPSPVERKAPPESGESLIASAYRDREYRKVVEEFDKIRQRYPAHVKGADDLFYLGMSYYYLSKNAQALRAFLELQYRFQGDPRSAEIHLMVARVLRRLGKPEQALDSLRHAIRLSGDGGMRLRVWEEKADILAGQGNYLQSLSVLDGAYRLSGGLEREGVLTRIRELLLIMPPEMIEHSIDRGGYSFPPEEMKRALARRSPERDEAGMAPGGVEERPPLPAPAVTEPAVAEPDADRRPLVKIGVLIPGSGRMQGYGREVLHGVEFLLETGVAPDFPYRIEVIYGDERDDEGAEEVVEEMAASGEILVLIGPLLSSTVERIVPVAERYSLAVFSPTASSPRLRGISRNFFRNCITLEGFGRKLAEAATESLELKKFAVFAPDDVYGFHYVDVFRREVMLRGGEIVASQAYEVGLTDFAKPIRALKREAGIPDPLPDLPAGYELPFEAVFLPGSAEEVGMILPQLAFHDIDVRRLTVLGVNGLNTPRLPEIGEDFAEGVIFTDGFFTGSPSPGVQRFVSRYRRKFGEDPRTFSAQAYDAAAIVLEALRRGADTREKMVAALGEVEDFPGVTGGTTLSPGGFLERKAFFGTVARGHLVSLEIAPSN